MLANTAQRWQPTRGTRDVTTTAPLWRGHRLWRWSLTEQKGEPPVWLFVPSIFQPNPRPLNGCTTFTSIQGHSSVRLNNATCTRSLSIVSMTAPGGPDTVHLKNIATNAGMPISKAKRYLRRLEQAGFLTFYTFAGKRDGKKLWNRLAPGTFHTEEHFMVICHLRPS